VASGDTAGRWSHNVHYHPLVLAAVPPGCGRALDVGCGGGLLAAKLAARCRHVTGIDLDAGIIDVAARRAAPGLAFVRADFRDCPFADGSFDFISAVASVHHMDFRTALTTMSRLLRPGGALAVIGLARDGGPADWAVSGVALPVSVANRRLRRRGPRPGGPTAPVRDAVMTWREVAATAPAVLPGARYRRHLLWRYSLQWRKPG
jgi:SAM-dependent methyltransferase